LTTFGRQKIEARPVYALVDPAGPRLDTLSLVTGKGNSSVQRAAYLGQT
jgi:hypothetical protein